MDEIKGMKGSVLLVLAVCAGALPAEILYNGIELPAEWPPREVHELDRAVQSVPYLDSRPAAVPIDVGRQLFVDDFLIEKTDLRREWHYPVKKFAGPGPEKTSF